jgi:hypothetical protein
MGSGRVFFGRHRRILGEKHTPGGKHRTEVTEVTEGDWPVAGCSLATPVAPGEKHTQGESIAQRSRRSQRGDGQWPGVLWAIPAASWRETHARGTR